MSYDVPFNSGDLEQVRVNLQFGFDEDISNSTLVESTFNRSLERQTFMQVDFASVDFISSEYSSSSLF